MSRAATLCIDAFLIVCIASCSAADVPQEQESLPPAVQSTQQEQEPRSRWSGDLELTRALDNRAEKIFYSGDEDAPAQLSSILDEINKLKEEGTEFSWDIAHIITLAVEFFQSTPDSIKTLYDQELAFRQLSEKDTTIISKVDYTGDGVDEIQYTTVVKDGDEIYVTYLVQSGVDTLFNKRVESGIPMTWSPYTEQRTDYEYSVRNAPPYRFTKPRDFRRIIPRIMARELSEITSESEDTLIPLVTEYTTNFDGYLLYVAATWIGEGVYIWYEPENKFLLFYSP